MISKWGLYNFTNTKSTLLTISSLTRTQYLVSTYLLIFIGIASQLSWPALFIMSWIVGALVMGGAQFVGPQGATLLLCSTTFTLFFKTLLTVLMVWGSDCTIIYCLGDYSLVADNYNLQLLLVLDAYSVSYIVLTNTIGLWALIFATNYMRAEPRLLNFVILLYFFLISMILLLAAGNFPTLMLGWELIGCFSFLLINFWTTRIGTAKSAFKAFFFNKLSDAALILSFIVLVIFLPNSFSLNFSNLFLLQGLVVSTSFLSINLLNVFIVGVVICSFCKSAQFGFHVWLPDSMEAPVPASALIHSATLVSAGIFLLGRHEILTSLSWVSELLVLWCSFTALYGGVVAAYQTDLKKILAYSTISHCGFLFLLVVYNNFFALVLYLHLHGWFKSYSFMAAGNIITKYLGYQDYRRMGFSPLTTTLESLVLLISISCLGGLPFLLGFFNKHYMLLLSYESVQICSNIFILGAAFTGLFYTIKTLYSLFFVATKTSYNNTHLVVSGVARPWVSSEPLSNLVLLGLYPILIISLVTLVLSQNYWSTSILYHSVFGIFFFIVYFTVGASYIKSQIFTPILTLVSVKYLYL